MGGSSQDVTQALTQPPRDLCGNATICLSSLEEGWIRLLAGDGLHPVIPAALISFGDLFCRGGG